jgi:tetratricopeptide (TPR) repeat protein
MGVFNEKDPVKRAALGEKFITDFKDSEGVLSAYNMVLGAYVAAKNWPKVMETADKIVTLPNADNKFKGYALANAMIAAQNSNNLEKTVSYGEKVLAIDPNDLNTMITLSAVYPAKLPADEAGKKAALDKSADLATKALAGIGAMVAKASAADKPQLEQIESNLHATLGLVAYNRPDTAKSIQEYELALQKAPKDEIAHYYLALNYQMLAAQASRAYQDAVKAENEAKAKKEEQPVIDELVAKRTGLQDDVEKARDKAMSEFAIAVALGGQLSAQAKDALTKMWMTKNENTNGLEEFIAQAKQKIG